MLKRTTVLRKESRSEFDGPRWITAGLRALIIAAALSLGLAAMSIGVGTTHAANPPTITGLTPNVGPAIGNTRVQIHGTHLRGTTEVRFGSMTATSFTVHTAGWITATSPAGAGMVDVTVTAEGETSPLVT